MPEATFRVAPCTEYPNDNPGLHCGAILVCAAIGADAVFELPPRAREADAPGASGLPVEDAEAYVEDAEAYVAPIGTLDAPERLEEIPETTEEDLSQNEPCAASEGFSAEEADTEVIEIVEEIHFDDAVDEELESYPPPSDAALADEGSTGLPADPSLCASPSSPADAFASFVLVLEDVAIASGADARARDNLRAYLGEMCVEGILADEKAIAWQGILRGESEDFGPCGSATLDEWAADLVARALGNASRAAGIRRDLRQRGVAAFGFIADAA
jgi:hypothetical protein